MSSLRARAGTTAGMPGAGALPVAYRNARIRRVEADIAATARNQTEAQRRARLGLVVPGSANDPGRVTRG